MDAHREGERDLGEIAKAAGRSKSQTRRYLREAGLSCDDPVDAAPSHSGDLDLSFDNADADVLFSQAASLPSDGQYNHITVDIALRQSSERVVNKVLYDLEDELFRLGELVEEIVTDRLEEAHTTLNDPADLTGEQVRLWVENTSQWLLHNARVAATQAAGCASHYHRDAMDTPWIKGNETSKWRLTSYLQGEAVRVANAIRDATERALHTTQPHPQDPAQLEHTPPSTNSALREELVSCYADKLVDAMDDLWEKAADIARPWVLEWLGRGDVENTDHYHHFFDTLKETTELRLEQGLPV